MKDTRKETKEQLKGLFKCLNEKEIGHIIDKMHIYTIAELRKIFFKNNSKDLSKFKRDTKIIDKGVYFIFNIIENENIDFSDTIIEFNKIYSQCNNKKEIYDIENLKTYYSNLKRNKRILYIGKADGKRGIYQRLRPYLGYKKNHSGGRAIWKIKEVEQLGVAWITLNQINDCITNKKFQNAEEIENKLLIEYIKSNKDCNVNCVENNCRKYCKNNLPLANQK